MAYVGVTPTTARLIACWTDPRREKKLFFYQNEALETAIYITEVARKYGDTWIENTHIRLQFLGEAVAMSFIGVVAGFFLALALSHWIGSIPFLSQLFEDEVNRETFT